MRVAAIDLGANTVRLLVGEPDGAGGFRPVFAAQEITRLGQGLLPDRELKPDPIRRSLAVLLMDIGGRSPDGPGAATLDKAGAFC